MTAVPTSPAVPMTVEDNGVRLVITDPIIAERVAGLVVRGDTGSGVYHPRPGVTMTQIATRPSVRRSWR